MTPHELSTWPHSLPRDIDIPPTNLCANLLVSAMRYPDRAVLVDDFGSLGYAELVDQVERIAAFLQNELGVQRGDRVLIYLQNGRGWIAAYFAILRINAVVVPVNPMNRRDELPHYLSDTGAVAAFCSADNVAELLAAPAAQQLRRVIVVGNPGPAEMQPNPRKVHRARQACAACSPRPPARCSRWSICRTRWPSFSTARAPPVRPRAACTPTARSWPAP